MAMPERWPSRLRAVRSAASRARAGPEMKATSAGHAVAPLTLDHQQVELAGARLAEDLARNLEAEDHAGLLLDDPRPAARRNRHSRLGRHIARTDVLGQGRGNELL